MISKKTNMIIIAIAALILFGLPWFGMVSFRHPAVYYTGMILMLIWSVYRILTWDLQDRKFYKRWGKRRDRSTAVGVLIEGSKFGFFFLIIHVFIRYSLGNLDHLYGWEFPSTGEIIFLLILAIGFVWICGATALYQNDKRYDQLQMKYGDY